MDPDGLEQRWKGTRWTIWVCAEPDGEKCDSGTHRKLIGHRCLASRGLHQFREAPRLATLVAVPE